MIQNSRSPVVKSRISSSSGNTMSVEKRSLAWTGTMSSLPYFTTRAPSSANACATDTTASAAIRGHILVRRFRAIVGRKDFIGSSPCRKFGCLWIPVVKPAGNRLNEQHEPGEESGNHKGQKDGMGTESLDQLRESRNHAGPPAKTSKPFSNPWASNASFRFWLS